MYNKLLRRLALPLTTLLFFPIVNDPSPGDFGLFVLWAVATALLGQLFVVLFGIRRIRRRYPSGGNL